MMNLYHKHVSANSRPAIGSLMPNTSPVGSHPRPGRGTFTPMEDRAGRVCDGANSLSTLAGLIPIKILPLGGRALSSWVSSPNPNPIPTPT